MIQKVFGKDSGCDSGYDSDRKKSDITYTKNTSKTVNDLTSGLTCS